MQNDTAKCRSALTTLSDNYSENDAEKTQACNNSIIITTTRFGARLLYKQN